MTVAPTDNTFGGGDWGVSEPTAPGRPFNEDVIYRPFNEGEWYSGAANWAANYWYNNIARPMGYENKPKIANEDGSLNWDSIWNDYVTPTASLYNPTNWPTLAGASANAVIGVYDGSIRAVNTVVGGGASVAWGLTTTVAGGFDWSKSSNALMRDGWMSWDDINQIFDPFENETTLGQQIVLGMNTFATNLGDTAIGLYDADLEDQIVASRQRFIADNTEERLTDPENKRALGSMWMLYDQNYNIWDEYQRDSAFEQMGPWQLSSGSLDAAWQFWAAPEVVGAKALGIGAKQARFYDMSQKGQRATMARDLADYRIYQMTGGEYGSRTTWGLMAERLATMDEAAIRKTGLARLSNDPEHVAFVMGRTHTPQEAGDALLALAGDRNAAARVAMRSPLAGDNLLQRFSGADELRRTLDTAVDDFITDPTPAPASSQDVLAALSGDRAALGRVAKASTDLNDPSLPPSLRAAAKQKRQQDAAERVLGTDAEVKQMQAVLDEWIAMSGGTTLREVPKNLRDLSKAQRKAARASGERWASTAFSMGPGGRVIRFIQSASQKPFTYRTTGMFRVTDDAEFAAELDSTLTTTKWLRRKAAYKEGDPRRMVTIFRDVQTEAGRTVREAQRVDVAEYRRMKMNEGLALSGDANQALATKRMNFVQSLENDMFYSLLDDYGVTAETAADLLENYKFIRNKVKDQLVNRGWVRNADGSIDTVSAELQTELAESIQFLDFDFIDMVIRTSEHGLLARTGRNARSTAVQLVGYFDMFWRPLALMRLGYTQRNLAESSLRSLAAFGSVGESGWKSEGLGNWAANAGWRASSVKDRIRNWRTPTARKLRTRITAEQGTAASNRKSVRSLEAEARKYERQAEVLRATERKIVEDEELARTQGEWRLGESATWDTAAEIGSAKVGEAVLDYADQIYIPAREVRPFGGLRSGIGTIEPQGAADLSDAPRGLEGLGFVDTGRPIAGGPDEFGGMLASAKERSRFDELMALGDNMTPEQLTEWRNLLYKDRILAARRQTRDGSWLASVNGDGTYTRLRNPDGAIQSTVSTAKPSDFDTIEGLQGIFVIPAGSQPLAVRSTVYGRTLDLRYQPEEYSDLLGLVGTVLRRDLTGPKGGKTNAGKAVDQAYRALFGGEPAKTQAEAWQRVKDMRLLLEYANADEVIAEAMRRKIWAAGLPADVRKALLDRNVLIPDDVLKARIGNRLGGLTTETAKVDVAAREAVIELRRQIADVMDGLPEGEFVWHGGQRVAGDTLSRDIPLTTQNMNNFRGPGWYSTRNGGIAGEYVAGREGYSTYSYGGKAIDDAVADGTEPVLYVADAPPSNSGFLDYDAPYQDSLLDDAFGEDLARRQERLEWQRELLADIEAEASERYGVQIDLTIDGLDEAVYEMTILNQADLALDVPEPPSMYDFITTLVVAQTDAGMGLDDAWELTTNALRARGFQGARHQGGTRNWLPDTPNHEVYIWWEPPPLTRVEEVSDQAIVTRDLVARLQDLVARKDLTMRAQEVAEGTGGYRFGKKDLIDFDEASGIAVADGVGADNIAAAAADLGYGKVLLHNGDIPGEKAVVYLNDSLDVNGGLNNAIDNAVPGYMDEAFEEAGPVFNWANVDQIASDVPPGMERRLRFKAREVGPSGAKRFDADERRFLISYMEEAGVTHVSVRTKNGSDWLTKSDLVPTKKAATEYVNTARGDLIEAEVAQRLSRNDDFTRVVGKWSEVREELAIARARVDQNEATLKELTEAYGRLRSTRKKKVRSGRGKTTYRGYTWDDAFAESEQGNKYLALASSDATVARDTIGYTNDMTASLRRTAEAANYKPSQKLYWDELTNYLNTMIRNDPVAMRVLKGESDEEIIKWLRSRDSLARATVRDTARSSDKDDLIEAIKNRRDLIEQYVPDEGLRVKLAEGDVRSDEVLIAQGWRDMPTLEAMAYADTSNKFTRFTQKTMRILGTLPEDTVIRHPFYRARFNEEMRRQVDLFDGPMVSDADLKKFRREAHKWALKSTRETLYTVTRLSTPAYALRFVLPFFPAWESSMKFWSKQAVRKPETVVRYSQIIGAEGSGGLVLDEDGMPLDGEGRSLRDIPKHLFSPGGGWLAIPLPGENMFGSLLIPKESMNVILPGKYPWLPTADPIVQIPLSWMAKNNPTEAAMIADWEAFGFPVGDILAEQSLPFGLPYDESEVPQMLAEATMPPWMKRGYDLLRGESSQDFLATTDAIHRDMLTRWELNGSEGKKPTWTDAMDEARGFLSFRIGSGLLSPAAVRVVGPYEFYVSESRRIDRKWQGHPDAQAKSDEEFLALYGETFFRYTKSISGSRGSGIAPTVGAQKAYEDNPEEATALARIGDSGRVLQVLTYPFGLDEDFSDIVYRSQKDTTIRGVQSRFLRGGPGTDQTILTGSAVEDSSQRSLGWIKYRQMEDALQAAATAAGLKNYQASPALLEWRRGAVQDLQQRYPAWAADKASYDTDGYQDTIWAMQILMTGPNYSRNYGNTPMYGYMQEYLQYRNDMVNALAIRQAAGGSARLDASSNADLKAYNDQVMLYFTSTDVDPQWLAFYTRFLERDMMEPVNPLPEELRWR